MAFGTGFDTLGVKTPKQLFKNLFILEKHFFYFFPSLRFLIFNSSTNTLIRQISHHPLVISRSNHHFPVNILDLLSFS